MDRFSSIQQMRNQVEEIGAQSDEFIPEPDWSEFRSDVRNALLSRSVKRASSKRWFTGLAFKPAMVFGLAAILIVGFAVTRAVWDAGPTSHDVAQVPTAGESLSEEAELRSLDAVARTDVFEDLLQLNADEVAHLQMILDDISPAGVSQQ
jgi:hypothetical protein